MNLPDDPHELAGWDEDLHGLIETAACAELRLHAWQREGLRTGRLRAGNGRGVLGAGFFYRVSRHLALRHAYPGWCITLRASDTGEVVRLPVA